MAIQKISGPEKTQGDQHTAIEYNVFKSVINNNADELSLRPAAKNGVYDPENLPPVYFEGITGAGTQLDPFKVSGGGFSEAQLITWLQSRPNFAADRFFRGDLTWVEINGNATPIAPTMTGDDTADTLTIAHSRGEAEIVVSVNNAADVALTAVAGWNTTTHKIDVGNVARAAGYWRARTKAASGFNASAYSDSPAFTVASLTTPAAPTLPVNDNTARTFDFTYSPGYTTASAYEYSLDGGTTIANLTAKPLVVGSIAYAIGVVRVRVKAVAGVSNASAWLSNTLAFTAVTESTISLTSWRTPINNGALNGANSFIFTTPSGQGFGGAKGNYMIPAGGTGWVEFTADTALNGAIVLASGIDTFGDRNGSGTASPLALDYANSRFQTWVAGNDNFANPRPAFGPNTKGRIRLDGTSAYFECSSDAGVTWQLMRTTAQTQVDLYVKAWSNINQTGTPVNNVRGFGLTLVS